MEKFQKRLVAVEDDPLILDVIKELYESKNLTVYQLQSGDSVDRIIRDVQPHVLLLDSGDHLHEVMKAFQPEILLLDRMLPGTDGLTLCREVREYNYNAIIIFLTSLGGDEDQNAGYFAGAQDYVVKPFSVAALGKKTDEWFKQVQQLKMLGNRVAYLHIITSHIKYALEIGQNMLNQEELSEQAKKQLKEMMKWLEDIERSNEKMKKWS